MFQNLSINALNLEPVGSDQSAYDKRTQSQSPELTREGYSRSKLPPLVYRVRGPLDIRRLEEAFQLARKKHRLFRSERSHDAGVQHPKRTNDDSDLELTVAQNSDFAYFELKEIPDFAVFGTVWSDHDIDQSPFGLIVARVNPEEHYLLFSLHHLAGDTESYSILLRDISRLYLCHDAERRREFCNQPLQLSDFIAWQNTQFESGRFTPAFDYWMMRLRSKTAPFRLVEPGSSGEAVGTTGRAIRTLMSIDENLKLNKFLKARGTPKLTWLLMCLRAQLAHASGDIDITVGYRVANRPLRDHKSIVGPIANVLPLRLKVDLSCSSDCMANLEATSLKSAFRNSKLPMSVIQSRLSDGVKLVNVYLEYHEKPPRDLGLGPNLNVQEVPLDKGGWDIELGFIFSELSDGSLGLQIEHQEGLYTDEWISNFAHSLLRLIEKSMRAHDEPLEKLITGFSADFATVERQMNATAREFPKKAFIDIFDQLARLCPNRIALSDETQRVSYGDLSKITDEVAIAIQTSSGSSEMTGPIAIVLGSSVSAAIAILGALRLGYQYIPVSPDMHRDEIDEIFEQSRPSNIITDRDTAGKLRLEVSVELAPHLVVAHARFPRNVKSSSNLDSNSKYGHGRGCACILFAIGNEGAPHCITGEALQNHLWGLQEKLQPRSDDVFLATSHTYSAEFQLEVLLPLITGAEVHFAPAAIWQSSWKLSDVLQEAGVTVLVAKPSVWEELHKDGWINSGVRLLLCSGLTEKGSVADFLAEQALNNHGLAFELFYPAEVPTYCSIAHIAAGKDRRHFPVANTIFKIIGSDGGGAELGASSELWIGGMAVESNAGCQHGLKTEQPLVNLGSNGKSVHFLKTSAVVRLSHSGGVTFLRPPTCSS